MQTDNMNGRSHYNPFVESWKRKNREIAERVNKKNTMYKVNISIENDMGNVITREVHTNEGGADLVLDVIKDMIDSIQKSNDKQF